MSAAWFVMWIEAISNTIAAGTSVAGVAAGFQSMSYGVQYMTEIENFTNQPLILIRSEVVSGYLGSPPTTVVMPGRKESYNAHKSSDDATGAIGAVAYKIGASDNVAAITISCPFDFNYYSNTLALGIYRWDNATIEGMPKNHKDSLYNQMYYDDEVNETQSLTLKQTISKRKEIWTAMKRKDFYYDSNPLQVYDDAGEYLLRGTMGTSHMPTVKISLFPTDPKRLAPSLKQPSIFNFFRKH